MINLIGDILIWIWRHWFVISIFLSVVIVFFQRNQPESVWAWLLALYFLPGIGFVLYLVLHQDMKKKHMFRIKGMTDASLYHRKDGEKAASAEISDISMREYSQLIHYQLATGGSSYTEDNSVEIITDGREKFERLIEEIDHAKYYIHLQYYIIQNDELFLRIKCHLYQKAREGVAVRILYDPLGCRRMPRSLWRELKENGILVGNFFPAMLGLLHVRINYRNHRKIVVIDGRVGFVGGYNIGREYISLDKRFGYWRDTHLILTGSSVAALGSRFALDWNYAAKENLFLKPELMNDRSEKMKAGSQSCAKSPIHKNCGVQIISSGPDSMYSQIRDTYVYIISHAKHSVCIQTPYFIPDKAIMNALTIAIRSGVVVKLMIPCKPDHPFVYWATYSYMGDLLRVGAKCYIYENGFLHAKGIVADGEIVCYGTANMDIRSFELNFEVNALIYDRSVAQRMESIFQRDIRSCREATWESYCRRGLRIRVKEQLSRLLSPVL